jgi:putative transposase
LQALSLNGGGRAVHPIRWYDRYRAGGVEALADYRSKPDRVWNRIPDDVRRQIVDLALELPELSPRELAIRFAAWDCQDFRVSAGIMGEKESHDVPTQRAGDPG